MKIWLDKTPPRKRGYEWCIDVESVVQCIRNSDTQIDRIMKNGHNCFLDRDYAGRDKCYAHANKWDITEISVPAELVGTQDYTELIHCIE